MMGMNLSRVQMHVVVIVLASHVINQMIYDGGQLYGLLIFLLIGFTQIFDRCRTELDFIVAKDNGIGSTTAVGAFHLRFEASQTASRGAM
jgi:hypothetical protein